MSTQKIQEIPRSGKISLKLKFLEIVDDEIQIIHNPSASEIGQLQ